MYQIYISILLNELHSATIIFFGNLSDKSWIFSNKSFFILRYVWPANKTNIRTKKKKNTRQRRITIEKNLHLKTVLMSNAANPTISHHYDHRQCLLDIQNSHACARIPKHADVSYSNKKEFSLACLPLFFSCIHLRIGTSKIRSYRSHTHKHTNTAHTSDSLHDGYSNSYSYTTYYSCKSTSTRKYFE